MRAIILDIPTTPIFSTPEFIKISDKLKQYRAYDQKVKIEDKYKIKFSPPRSYNRGLLYISAILERMGIRVTYYNSDYDVKFWEKCKKEIFNADLLLSSAKTNNYPIILDIFKKAKKINRRIVTIIGGPHPTAKPQECLDERSVDLIVMGEGELTLEELCHALIVGGIKYENILGLAFKKAGKVYINKLRPLITDLDNLPMPAYHLLPGGLKSYHVYIDTSRGCGYECGFCSGPKYWRRKIRTRSFGHFYRELMLIRSLIKDYNFLHISDPMLGATEKQIEILNSLRGKQCGLYFSCDVKANYVKKDLIKTMMECGIILFSVGIETLNDKSLRLIKKNCSAQVEIDACRLIKRFEGSFVKSYWIVGLPGENDKSLAYNDKQIYDILNQGIVDQVCHHMLVPYPGTGFFEKSQDFGINIIHKNWLHYEGRSYPTVYNLEQLSGENIYKHFLQGQKNELLYYKDRYPKLLVENKFEAKQKNLSFSQYKGRLI